MFSASSLLVSDIFNLRLALSSEFYLRICLKTTTARVCASYSYYSVRTTTDVNYFLSLISTILLIVVGLEFDSLSCPHFTCHWYKKFVVHLVSDSPPSSTFAFVILSLLLLSPLL
jgi:hypothetical protein